MRNVWLCCATAVLFLGACRNKEEVTVEIVRKTPQAAAAARDTLRWQLPEGWREEAGQGMRFATLLAGPVGRGYEVVVTRLDGEAGGVLANVNRWRWQLELGPINATALEKAAIRVPSAAGKALLFDIRGKEFGGQRPRMLAAVVKTRESSWFFKMTGPSDDLQGFVAPFKSLLGSLSY